MGYRVSALAEAYAAEYADKSGVLSAMIDKQATRANEYPITRKQARAIGREAAGATREAAADFAALSAQHAHHVTEYQLRQQTAHHGIAYPESEYGRHCEVARLTDVGWWSRKIRPADWRKYETQRLRLGEVRQFVSDEIARARQWHRRAIRQQLENLFLVRDDGEALITMAQASDASVANPALRRAEMIVRAKGLARWRANQGFTWTFATITAPSKYHRMRTEGGRLVPNPRWQGATPRDTQNYLVAVWARIRAKLARLSIDWSAFRTVEPHADGTPHWHLCIFVPMHRRAELCEVLRHYALEEDGDEAGASKHRCTFEHYDGPADDAAAIADRCIAYLIAYVSKNIDGAVGDAGGAAGNALDSREGVTVDLGPAVEAAARVEAWATLWGIRQFAEIGGGPVTAYRELRRIRQPFADEDAEAVRQKADAGDYAGFIGEAHRRQLELWTQTTEERLVAEGGPEGIDGRQASPELADLAIAKGLLNQWGEPVRRWVLGVAAAGKRFLTRNHSWRIVDSSGVEAIAVERATAAYWRAAAFAVTRKITDKPGVTERLVALAPGFFFSRAAPPRALDLCK